MKPYKGKLLLSALLIATLTCFLTSNSYAQLESKERGWKGPLCKRPTCKNELLKELKKVQGDRYQTVEGYIIQGDDIIAIIKESNIDIKIYNSIIKGGLDFSKIPEVNGKREVNNKIVILDSEIGSRLEFYFAEELQEVTILLRLREESILAQQTHFNRDIFFSLKTTFNGDVDFAGATFNRNAIFSNTTFSGYTGFSGVTFVGKAYFSYAKFNRDTSFVRATFDKEANFGLTVFNGEADFPNSTFKQGVNFDRAEFNGYTNFSGVTFSGETIFWNTSFTKVADFRDCSFSGIATFLSTNFIDVADFSNTTFSRNANFQEAVFEKAAYFRKATFYGLLSFANSSFKGYVGLRDTTIKTIYWINFSSSSSVFGLIDILGRVELRDAQVTEAYFEDIFFKDDVDFSDTEFGSPFLLFDQSDVLNWQKLFNKLKENKISEKNTLANQINEKLDQTLERHGINLSKVKEFDDSLKIKFIVALNSILENTDLSYEEFSEQLDKENQIAKKLLKKDRDKLTRIETTLLNRFLIESLYPDIIASKTREIQDDDFATVFRFVTFGSDVSFVRTKFYSNTAFESLTFKKETNFTSAEFKKSIFSINEPIFSLSYLNFRNLIINFEQLPKLENWVRDSKHRIKGRADRWNKSNNLGKPLQPVSQVLAELESTFLKENKLSDMNEAHYHMKIAELDEKIVDCKNTNRDFIQCLITTEEGREWLKWGWSSGYGVKLWRVVKWYIGVWVFFAFIYYALREDLETKKNKDTKPDSEFRSRLLNFPWHFLKSEGIKNKKLLDFFTALRFSKVLLFKIGRRDTVASGKLVMTMVWFEWILGYYLLLVFIITLTNTVPILNSILSSVF